MGKGWFWPGFRIHFSYNRSPGKVRGLWHGERFFCLELDGFVLFKSLLEASLNQSSFSAPLRDWPAKPQMRLNVAGRRRSAGKGSRSSQQFCVWLGKGELKESFKVRDMHAATGQAEPLSKSSLSNVFIITSPPIMPQMWLLTQRGSRADTGAETRICSASEGLSQGEILINHLVMLVLCYSL